MLEELDRLDDQDEDDPDRRHDAQRSGREQQRLDHPLATMGRSNEGSAGDVVIGASATDD